MLSKVSLFASLRLPMLVEGPVNSHPNKMGLTCWAFELIQQRFICYLSWGSSAGPKQPVIAQGGSCMLRGIQDHHVKGGYEHAGSLTSDTLATNGGASCYERQDIMHAMITTR